MSLLIYPRTKIFLLQLILCGDRKTRTDDLCPGKYNVHQLITM